MAVSLCVGASTAGAQPVPEPAPQPDGAVPRGETALPTADDGGVPLPPRTPAADDGGSPTSDEADGPEQPAGASRQPSEREQSATFDDRSKGADTAGTTSRSESATAVPATEAATSESSADDAGLPSYGASASVRYRAPGEVPRHGTASRVDVPLAEIPATVQIVESEQLKQRGAADLNSALYYVPGLNPVWRYGGFQQIRSRGFRAIVLNDGLRDNRSTFVNSHPQTGLWSLERIEVLKGPSAVLYGYGSVGGVVNLVHKRPQRSPAYEAEVGLGTPTQRRAHVGATGPITDTLSYRLDAGHTFKRDFRGLTTNRTGGSLALAYEPSRRHRFGLRTALSRDHYNTDSGVPTIAADGSDPESVRRLPANAPLDARYNSRQDFLRYQHWDVDFTYEARLSPALTLTERFAYTRDEYEYFSSEYLEYVPAMAGDRPQVRLGWADPDDPDSDSSGYFYFFHHWFPLDNQLDLKVDFDTGPVTHQAVVGYEFAGMFNGSSDRASNIFGEPFPTIDWANPIEPRRPVPIQRDGAFRFDMHTHSVYAHEHARLPGGVTVVLGGRQDWFRFRSRRDTLDPVSGETLQEGELDDRDEQALTGRAGVVYSPVDALAAYVSFSTAFKPNASISARERRIRPERARQLEGGLRLLLDPAITASVAVYQIWKRDVTLPHRTERDEFVLADMRGRGVELDVTGRPIEQLAITAGAAWTDTRFGRSPNSPYPGKRAPFVPVYSANLWLQVFPVSSLGLGIGGRAMGKQYGDENNRLPMRAYALVDAAMWYEAKPLRVTFTVNNVLDHGDYFVSSIYDQLTPGPSREVLAQLSLEL